MRTPQLLLHQEDIPPSISQHFPSHPRLPVPQCSPITNVVLLHPSPSSRPRTQEPTSIDPCGHSSREQRPANPSGLCLSHWSRITDGSERARLGRAATGTLFPVLLPTRKWDHRAGVARVALGRAPAVLDQLPEGISRDPAEECAR